MIALPLPDAGSTLGKYFKIPGNSKPSALNLGNDG